MVEGDFLLDIFAPLLQDLHSFFIVGVDPHADLVCLLDHFGEGLVKKGSRSKETYVFYINPHVFFPQLHY